MAEEGRTPRTLLEDLSLDLTHLAAMLAHLAEEEANRRERRARAAGPTPRALQALIGARHARSAVFGLDLANPGWSLLLELYRVRLEGGPARVMNLHVAARLAPTTVFRWLDLFCESGHARRFPDPDRKRGTLIELTDAGAEAMRDYFAAVAAGWE